MPAATMERPPLPSADTLDEAEFLAGRLSSSGVAQLDLVPGERNGDSNGPLLTKVHFSPALTSGSTTSDDVDSLDGSVSPEEVEDYDAQKIDPTALVTRESEEERQGDLDGTVDGRPLNMSTRRGSIPIKLEKTDRRGRYILTADDPEIRGILKRALAREQEGSSGKNKVSLRDLVFTRRFTTFDRQNSAGSESPFYGFFVLFWLATGLLLTAQMAKNWRATGSVLGENEIMRLMFRKDVLLLGFTDGVMCAATAVGLLFQKIILRGYIDWNQSGWIIQNVWQTFYLGAILFTAYYRDWPWTHTIFVVLHGLVFVMKQHSYGAYNGYLSVVYKRKKSLERRLQQLHSMTPVDGSLDTMSIQQQDFASSKSASVEDSQHLRHRRIRSMPSDSLLQPVENLSEPSAEISSVATAISDNQPLDAQQMALFSRTIRHELSLLSTEIKGKCSATKNYYPDNLNLFDFAEWTCFPTLVYELEYPRQESINWAYVAEKTGATFGVILVMQIISQAYIYPVVASTMQMHQLPVEERLSLLQRWEFLFWASLDMLLPLLLEQLLTWYLIWECVLNVLAELTRFADRGFYADWWNSTTWDQYARDWNRPVHNFLLRHVYHSSISSYKLSKFQATMATFVLSALVHELVMACLFRRIRGYLAIAQLLQIPLVTMGRTKFMKQQKVLGNLMFWTGMFIGPSFLTCLYLIL